MKHTMPYKHNKKKEKKKSHFTARRSRQRKSDTQQRSGLRKQWTELKA
jgi:hypothetical protein